MSSWAHAVLYILDRSPFGPVTIHLWATRSCFTLHWPLNAQMLGPNIFSSVNFWLPDDFVFVQLQIVIAVEAFWAELRNGIICVAL